jgi:enoyl-CoA hydratase
MSSEDTDILVQRVGAVGRIVLNRPKALNALTHDMVLRFTGALQDWADDPDVGLVTIGGAGDRGLCAGGDIRSIHDDIRAGTRRTLDFWRDEYRLNATLARYPKPTVAFMDGTVMGGGVGISGHARHRVVTETSQVGMPEVAIGFVPDVGGTWLLSRAPGALGLHAAASAARLGAGDAVGLGLADWYVRRDRLRALHGALADLAVTDDLPEAVGRMISAVAEAPPDGRLEYFRPWIDPCYEGTDDPAEVLARMGRCDHSQAAPAAKEVAAHSPTSVAVALRAIRRARELPSLEAALDQEFRVSTRCFEAPDMVEGIRALVVDKDRNPRWDPPTPDLVDDAAVDGFFAPLGSDELGLATGGHP